MATICLKCGYERKSSDSAPDWQCPSCGIVYAKFEAHLKRQQEGNERATIEAAKVRRTEADNRAKAARPKQLEPNSVWPSGYVKNNLIPGEQVIHWAKIHWFVFVPGIVMFVLGAGLMSTKSETGVSSLIGFLLLVFALISEIKAIVLRTSTELAVTSKRVIAKTGLIARRTAELNHSKVESFNVNQGIFGRIFGFGTVTINGTGGGKTPIPSIMSPLEFRREAMQAIDASQT